MNTYGKELILDLHDCDPSVFNRRDLDDYFEELCDLIDMQMAERFWWDDLGVPEEEKQTLPHLVGTSAIQFITTSNITIHTLNILKAAYINIFTCKDFDPEVAEKFTAEFFKGRVVNKVVIDRI